MTRVRAHAMTLAGLLAALALCWAATAQAQAQSGAALDAQEALRTSQAVLGKTIGEHVLQDREGRTVRLSQYRGKPLLVSFIYTGCFQICPTSTRALDQALAAMQSGFDVNQFNVVSIGFNPPADSPPAMKDFARRHRVGFANWDFLSPHMAGVEALARDFGFAYAPTQAGFDHLLQVSVLDAEGRIAAQVYGDDFSAERLGEPLRRLLRGQSLPPQASLADIVERVRLLCSVYDPLTGQYRVSYALAFEIAGGLTFIVSLLWFLALEWRDRRRLRRLTRAAQAMQRPNGAAPG